MDRNSVALKGREKPCQSLSARRAWIEIFFLRSLCAMSRVALRKESVDRNADGVVSGSADYVALRKESVDRNACIGFH